jgi:hypothetical protein
MRRSSLVSVHNVHARSPSIFGVTVKHHFISNPDSSMSDGASCRFALIPDGAGAHDPRLQRGADRDGAVGQIQMHGLSGALGVGVIGDVLALTTESSAHGQDVEPDGPADLELKEARYPAVLDRREPMQLALKVDFVEIHAVPHWFFRRVSPEFVF